MKVIALMENLTENRNLETEHGLSLYIETSRHNILFDTGAGPKFAENAKKLGVDLAAVDVAFLSHGHYDHGGGLETFLALNKTAAVYVQAGAFHQRYAHAPSRPQKYIGLDRRMADNPHIVMVNGNVSIDDQLALFSIVEGRRFIPSGNRDMYVEEGGERIPDDFSHEQNLIIRDNGHIVLVAGCAHRGIVNIVDQFISDYGEAPDLVIGGFHLHNRSTDTDEPEEVVEAIGKALAETKAKYSTGHCTGQNSYGILKDIMGENLSYLSTGMTIHM